MAIKRGETADAVHDFPLEISAVAAVDEALRRGRQEIIGGDLRVVEHITERRDAEARLRS